MIFDQKKIKEKSFGLLVLGLSLIAISLGGLNWNYLIRSGLSFGIFILATLLGSYFIGKSLIIARKKDAMNPSIQLIGLISLFLLLLFFGIQSPQLPLKTYILIAGVLLLLPSIREGIFEKTPG